MILTITIDFNEATGDLKAAMTPTVGLLQTHRTPGSHILIWELPTVAGKDKYKAVLEKQKTERRLKSV